MKTIFITSFHILILRNILSSPALELLLKRDDVRVVLLVPDYKKSFFESEFNHPSIAVAGVPRLGSRREAILRYLALAALNTRSLAIKRKTELKGRGSRLVKIIGNSRFWRFAIRWLDRMLCPRGRFTALFDLYRPDLIFSTDVQNENDVRLMHEARSRGVPIVGMVRSWDNLTSKGILRILPDKLAVNNELVKREAVRLHGVKERDIAVVGIPHYDRYLAGPAHPRETFLKQIGVDVGNKYIVYAPTGDRYLGANDVDLFIIKLLSDCLPERYSLIVRLPPADTVNLERESLPANVIVMRPGIKFGADPNIFRDNELTRRDDEILRDTLFFSELVVSGPSTIIIDAAVFDKPIVLIGFDGQELRPYLKSIRRYYDYDHMRSIMESGGARLAASAEELRRSLQKYLSDPKLDGEGRKTIAREQCWKMDGQSSRRLADVLLAYL